MATVRNSKFMARIGVLLAVVLALVSVSGMVAPAQAAGHVGRAEAAVAAQAPIAQASPGLGGATTNGAVAASGVTTNATVPVYYVYLSCSTTASVPFWSTLRDYGIAVREDGGTYVRWWYGMKGGAYVDVWDASNWAGNKVSC